MPRETSYLFVCVNGYYKTGSSAVVGLLKEYDVLNVLDGEIRMFKTDLVSMIKSLAEGSTMSDKE